MSSGSHASRLGSDETAAKHVEDPACSTMRSRRPLQAVAAALIILATSTASCGDESEARVFFAQPRDGAEVTAPFRVEMGVENFVVEPAADGITEGRGHLHIMVDTPCVQPRLTVPPDDRHLHFGGGQTEAVLHLEPGEHFLCLQAADGDHTALAATDEITVTVISE